MLISLFIGCYNDTLFPETGRAVVTLLERLGTRSSSSRRRPAADRCTTTRGTAREALPLMKHFLRVFAQSEVICVPSASCVAMMRDHYPLMAEKTGDRALKEEVAVAPAESLRAHRAARGQARCHRRRRLLSAPRDAAHSCHSLRSLCVGDRPARLLRAVRGLQLTDLPRNDECCGFGGTFAVKNAGVSTAMAADKVRARRSKPERTSARRPTTPA